MSRKLAAAAVAVVLGVALEAGAVLYTPTLLQPPSPVPQASNPTIADVAAALGVSVANVGTMLYKWTPGNPGTEDGNASLFDTTIANSAPPAGEQTLTITYTGASLAPLLSYIVVKDGRAGWTVWSAASWNGLDQIQVDNRELWNPTHNALSGISHVAIYGGGYRPPTRVPDGATTAMLLGIAMVGVGSCKRFIRG